MRTVGSQLRHTRQAKGLTVDAVARVTKLSRSAIAALEEDRFEDLPAAVYARGFLRIYAEFLELDSALLVGDYDAALARKQALEAQMALDADPAQTPAYLRQAPQRSLAMTPATVLLLCATAAIALAFVWSVQRKARPAPVALRPGLHAPLPASATGPLVAPVASRPAKPAPSLPPLPGRDAELPRR
ncbi:MAG: helix-turn-helix domain-containing protein [Deltaproteobacteria bacterium]|nr:helix-turn-helix domain-containing protein [Deltaproteobacteria bacterium]